MVPIGDQVLEQVATRLKKCLREYDVLARFEDDEFAVLLPGADAIAARTVGERITQAMSKEAVLAAERKVSLSIGGALWVPPSAESSGEIVKRAGVALREARKLGGGRTHVDG